MTDESPRRVWTYWESRPGSSRATYLDLCLETIRRHSGSLELHVLDHDTVPPWLPDLDVERWERLPAPNYRSDYARSRLLQRYGGIWIDLDTVALAPLSELFSHIDSSGIVCWGKELGRFFGNMCAAVPGSPFVDAWVSGQDDALSRHSDWSTLPYSALAQDVCWSISKRLPWMSLPMGRVAPVPWFEWRRFFSRLESPSRLLVEEPFTVVLWNAVMAPLLRPRSHAQLLSGHMLLSRLLRVGMGISSLKEEDDMWTRLQPLSSLRFSSQGQGVEIRARRVLQRAGRR